MNEVVHTPNERMCGGNNEENSLQEDITRTQCKKDRLIEKRKKND